MTFQITSSSVCITLCKSYNPNSAVTLLVWAAPASLATTTGITYLFSLPPGTEMFQFPGFACRNKSGILHLQCSGLPHSDICGSMLIGNSPQLFAAYHVLLRLWEPRHPPYALTYFFQTLLQAFQWTISLLISPLACTCLNSLLNSLLIFFTNLLTLLPTCQWTLL